MDDKLILTLSITHKTMIINNITPSYRWNSFDSASLYNTIKILSQGARESVYKNFGDFIKKNLETFIKTLGTLNKTFGTT